jgi:alkylhydroperoxidase family enzyme
MALLDHSNRRRTLIHSAVRTGGEHRDRQADGQPLGRHRSGVVGTGAGQDLPAPAQRVGSARDERIPSAKLAALAQWPTSPLFSDADRAALGFAEQFIMDVAGVSAEQRKLARGASGPRRARGLRDGPLSPRLRPAHADGARPALSRYPGRPRSRRVTRQERRRRPARGLSVQGDVDALLMAIARLNSLDMVTTEVVRLRGARRHNCRICQSTRSVKALDAGADEAMFDKIDHYEDSDLLESHKVALRLIDAIITQPTEIDPNRWWPRSTSTSRRPRSSSSSWT